MNNSNMLEVINFVIQELKDYKKNIAIYKQLVTEIDVSIKAQTLSDMPRSITNKFSSSTENAIFSNSDTVKLYKDIERVKIWVDYLKEDEKFIIEHFYFEGISYNSIANKWANMGKPYFSVRNWKNKRKASLKKICEMYLECKGINLQKV